MCGWVDDDCTQTKTMRREGGVHLSLHWERDVLFPHGYVSVGMSTWESIRVNDLDRLAQPVKVKYIHRAKNRLCPEGVQG